ncbi:MAG TPA: ATP-binding protein [Dehalococcoidia bacterium]|nr:ATP-binding protein [Dehalococcoidia bacterium]
MKKLIVCGKGGSGKSSIVALLANGICHRGYGVLVVDSDESNSGLYRMLGFDRAPSPLMELVGGKKGIKQKMAPKFSAGESEPQMTILAQDEIWIADIPPQHMLSRDGIALVSIGKILQSLEGCACPMGVLSREFLKKLRLKDNEVTIVDMEAGVEHFGRGIETSIDSVLIVVEPSFESLELAEKVNGFAVSIGVDNMWAILNKITSEKLALKLKIELTKRNIAVIGSIHYDTEIFEACLEGRPIYNSRKTTEDLDKFLDSLL